jgi:hypothetical protein
MSTRARLLRNTAFLAVLGLLLLPTGCLTRCLSVDGKVKVSQGALAVAALGGGSLFMHPLVFRSLAADSNAILTDPHLLYPGFDFRLLAGMHYALGSKLFNQDYLYATAGVGALGTALFYSLIMQPLPGGAGYQVSAADAGGVVPGSTRTVNSLSPEHNLLDIRFVMTQVSTAWFLQAYAMAWGATSPVLVHEWDMPAGDDFLGQASAGFVGAAKGAIFTALLMEAAYGSLAPGASAFALMRFRFATAFALLLETMFLLDSVPPDWRPLVLARLVFLETALALLLADPYLSPPAKAGGLTPGAKLVAKAHAMVAPLWVKVDDGAAPDKAWKALAKIRATLAKAETAAPQE